ncbi:S8 family serine peptidase, partial [Deinococcus sp.]|uniref:S8 family serine peptidase n=1 Tax=Deinococcus sp. TaxID=47478 RepID=UPI002869DABD
MTHPRPPHSALLALLTLGLLSSCGTVTDHAVTASGAAMTAQATTTDLPKNYKYLHNLTIPATVTEAALHKMYGGYTVSFHPELGTATIANNNATKGSYDGVTVELNAKSFGVTELGFGTWATGFGTWASGYSTWASGYSTWASGTTGTGAATTFAENVPLWNMVKLSEAQSLVPELGQGIKVAVIDTGIDLNHPAFAGKLDTANAKDYIDGDSTPQEVNANTTGGFSDGYGHGTAVTSILLQVAPKITILPIRALDPSGSGDTSTIASAVYYAVSKCAKVINLSLGCTSNSDALYSSIKNAVYKG